MVAHRAAAAASSNIFHFPEGNWTSDCLLSSPKSHFRVGLLAAPKHLQAITNGCLHHSPLSKITRIYPLFNLL